MASTLSQEIDSKRAVSANLGKQLLDVITSGMYSDPRMAIREYIQNAADSIDLACATGGYKDERYRIQMTLDGRERMITIEDNGLGLDGRDVDSRLGSLGCSIKIGAGQRGFRGIGRLGGLAYCDVLRFETRRTAREPVHVVEWNGKALRERVSHASSHEQLADAVKRIAFVGNRRADRTLDYALHTREMRIELPENLAWDADKNGLRAYRTDSIRDDYHPDASDMLAGVARIVAKLEENRTRRLAEEARLTAERADAEGVYVCLSDSLRAGNCRAASEAWMTRHGLEKNRHYPAVEILGLIGQDDPGRARLAISAAVHRHHREIERGYAELAEHVA
ncbi:MAG: ATP-binding protein [Smithella sp.]|jgi:hypothetical protein